MHSLRFTAEALKEQNGAKVPLKDRPGGKVIGEATMHYDPEAGELRAQLRVDDPDMAEFLKGPAPWLTIAHEGA